MYASVMAKSVRLSDGDIYFFGRKYEYNDTESTQQKEEKAAEFLEDFRSRIWVTYRKEFTAIQGSSFTSDSGWGCMLRSGQMMLSQAFVMHLLGREWRFNPEVDLQDNSAYLKILSWFLDRPEPLAAATSNEEDTKATDISTPAEQTESKTESKGDGNGEREEQDQQEAESKQQEQQSEEGSELKTATSATATAATTSSEEATTTSATATAATTSSEEATTTSMTDTSAPASGSSMFTSFMSSLSSIKSAIPASIFSFSSLSSNVTAKQTTEAATMTHTTCSSVSGPLVTPYSLHRMVGIGSARMGIAAGEWVGPTTVAHILQHLVSEHALSDFTLWVSNDGVIYKDQIYKQCQTDSSFKSVLILLPLRLGLEELNPAYVNELIRLLDQTQSVGIIGGRPKASLYFMGHQNTEVIYLDPHVTRPAVELDQLVSGRGYESFHCANPYRMPLSAIDPTLGLGFYCKDAADFENLCEQILHGKDAASMSILHVQHVTPNYDEDDDEMDALSTSDKQPDSTTHTEGEDGQQQQQQDNIERRKVSTDEFVLL